MTTTASGASRPLAGAAVAQPKAAARLHFVDNVCVFLTILVILHELKFLSPNAYTAYIIHAQVITATALVLRDVPIYPLLKFALVVLVAVPVTFGLSSLIRKLPYTDRVL